MQYIKRKIKSDVEVNQKTMTISLINGVRLSLRFADKEKPETDIVINFTKEETERIMRVIK